MTHLPDNHLDITPRGDQGPAPLSYAQELLWLMDQASPGVTAWNVPRAYRLRGALDPAALQAALDGLVARHEVLRTTFHGPESAPQQVVHPASKVAMEIQDLSELPMPAREAAQDRLVRGHARAAIDLSTGPLLRALLVRVGANEHILCLNSHHIVFDGWSRSVLLRDLSTLYDAAHRGVAPAMPNLPVQFADFATWERSADHARALLPSLEYWRNQLAGPLPSLDLPTDRPRPTTRGYDGDRAMLLLPTPLVDAVGALARAHNVTPYMVLLAAYVTLLHRLTGQDDIVVGSPIAGRLQSEIEDLIGYFANTLVLRNRLAPGLTFTSLLAQVRDTTLSAYEHQEVPFEQLVLELQKGQQLSDAPLFQAVLTMEDTVPGEFALADVEVEALGIELGAAKFDLTLMVSQQPDGLRLSLWHRQDLHTASTAQRFLGYFRTLLEAAVAGPAQPIDTLSMIGDEETAAILTVSNGPRTAPVGWSVPERITTIVASRPDDVAVVSDGRSITWRALDAQSNRIAHSLIRLGVAKGSLVGICLERSIDTVVSMLAVMRAGGGYVPLAPELPPARLAQQVTDAGLVAVLTDSGHRERLPSGTPTLQLDEEADAITRAPTTAPAVALVPDDPAYVLFTSGSTGTPKGVAVTHGNLAHYIDGIISRLELGEGPPRQFATVSTFAADLGNTTVFPALVTGGTLHVIPAAVATDAARFGDYVAQHPIDLLKITPNHLRALLSGPHGDAILPQQWLVVGGEACSWELADQVLRAGRCRLLNHYGPTETTVGCCTFEVTTSSAQAARAAGALTVPFGVPLPNVSAYVVDRLGHLVPSGVTGELWIGGAGVATGYLHRPDLTAERFIPDPFAAGRSDRVYRSGDRVRRLGTGALEFLGRIDDQVKVRGFRVELGEIEQALLLHPGVAQAAALMYDAGTATDEAALVVYVVAKSAGYAAAHAERPTAERVTGFLAERLPEYMVPGQVIFLDRLPLGPNGKLDRAALPAPEQAAAVDHYLAPRTETEQAVAQIWGDVLKRERIGVVDNFLALGGHSLLAIRVLGRISKQLGVRLPLRTLFEAPTVEQLAQVIEAQKEAEIQRALTSIEQMSDDEVQRALDAGSPEAPPS